MATPLPRTQRPRVLAGTPRSFEVPDSRILQVFPSGLWIESVRLRLNRSGVRGEFHPEERRFTYGYYESASDGKHHNLVISRQFETCDEAVTAGEERFGFDIPARLKNDTKAAIARFSEVFPHGLHIHTGLSITK